MILVGLGIFWIGKKNTFWKKKTTRRTPLVVLPLVRARQYLLVGDTSLTAGLQDVVISGETIARQF